MYGRDVEEFEHEIAPRSAITPSEISWHMGRIATDKTLDGCRTVRYSPLVVAVSPPEVRK